MILRRLAEAIREQNWFTVFIEFMIVVSGIFVGLQVDDWNKSRLDRADERIFLLRLHEELVEASGVRKFIPAMHLANHEALLSAIPKIYDGAGDSLTDAECQAIENSATKPGISSTCRPSKHWSRRAGWMS